MFVKLHGPPINAWNPEKYAKSWLRARHRTADDQRVKKGKMDETPEREQEQKAAKQRV